MMLGHLSWEDEDETPASWYISWVEGLAVLDEDLEPYAADTLAGFNIVVLKGNRLRDIVGWMIFEYLFLHEERKVISCDRM